jgi:hypothetical protein
MRKAVFLSILLLCLSGTLQAATYSYDFSSMGIANGTSYEGATVGHATFTSEDGNLQYTSNYGGGLYDGAGGSNDIYIDFSQGVDNLSFTAGDGAGDDDAFAVSLYEFGTNNFLGTWSTPVFGGANEPEWYTLAIAITNVGRVVFDQGNSGVLPGTASGSGGVVMTEFSYSVVPIPAAVWLFGSGLLGIFGLSKRKRAVC